MKKIIAIFVWVLMANGLIAATSFSGKQSINAQGTSTRTPTRTPTPTPTTPIYDFILSKVNKVAPEDILAEVSFFGGGGGTRCVPGADPEKPVIGGYPVNTELMMTSSLIACGWEKGESLKGTIVYPNGKTTTRTLIAEQDSDMYYGMLSFRPSITDPVGAYTFKLEGKSGTVQAVARYKKPVGIRLFAVSEYQLLLYGFGAKEKVKLFFFDGNSGLLSGWEEYEVGNNGQAYIKTSVKTGQRSSLDIDQAGFFIVVGEKSGEARLLVENYMGIPVDKLFNKTIDLNFCPGKKSRLTVFINGRVAYTDGALMNVRAAAGLSKSVKEKIAEGTEFRIDDGPVCADGLTWWKISYEKNSTGWVAETSPSGVYLIERFP